MNNKINKNIMVVGAMAVGLYLLSQANKIKKVVVKKKAPRRPKRKYLKPHHPYLKKPKVQRVIARKKAIYNKPKIKKAVARRKPIYHKPIPRVIARRKPIYHKPIPRVATTRKQIIKRMQRRKRRR